MEIKVQTICSGPKFCWKVCMYHRAENICSAEALIAGIVKRKAHSLFEWVYWHVNAVLPHTTMKIAHDFSPNLAYSIQTKNFSFQVGHIKKNLPLLFNITQHVKCFIWKTFSKIIFLQFSIARNSSLSILYSISIYLLYILDGTIYLSIYKKI